MRARNWADFLACLIDKAAEECKIFHLWGHSWKIEEQGLWQQLESFFERVAAQRPKSCSIGELIQLKNIP